MKKYNVQPNGENVSVNVSLLNQLKTNSKSEAISYAKKLQKTFDVVTFNVDTYNGVICIKNEFGTYNKGIKIYSVIDYKEKKQIKNNYKMSDYFGEDVLSKIN